MLQSGLPKTSEIALRSWQPVDPMGNTSPTPGPWLSISMVILHFWPGVLPLPERSVLLAAVEVVLSSLAVCSPLFLGPNRLQNIWPHQSRP